jgi:hypothetical protein
MESLDTDLRNSQQNQGSQEDARILQKTADDTSSNLPEKNRKGAGIKLWPSPLQATDAATDSARVEGWPGT